MGAWPPISTRPSGSSTALLWYVRFRASLPASRQLPPVYLPLASTVGVNSSAVVMGDSYPGATTSSMSAPLMVYTVPSGEGHGGGLPPPPPQGAGRHRARELGPVAVIRHRST